MRRGASHATTVRVDQSFVVVVVAGAIAAAVPRVGEAASCVCCSGALEDRRSNEWQY